jgi:hypothetical protein
MDKKYREKEIAATLRRLQQNRVINLINDIWKLNPDQKISELIRIDKDWSDEEVEKHLQDELRRFDRRRRIH